MARPIQSCLEEFQLLPAPEPVHEGRPARHIAEARRAGASEDACSAAMRKVAQKPRPRPMRSWRKALEQARAQADCGRSRRGRP